MLKIVVTDVNVPCIGNMVQGEPTHQLRNSCSKSNSCYLYIYALSPDHIHTLSPDHRHP